MYRKIAGAVTNKTFGIAGLPAELDELSFSRGRLANARIVAAAGASHPHLTRPRFAREVARSAPGAPNEWRASSCTCSIPIAALTATRAASFA